jgi:hypothetical protein
LGFCYIIIYYDLGYILILLLDMTSDTETAEDFLKIAAQFKLGCLLT